VPHAVELTLLEQKDGQSLVKVSVAVNVSEPTAAGQLMLRLINSGTGDDVFLGKYNAGLPAGIQTFDWHFSCVCYPTNPALQLLPPPPTNPALQLLPPTPTNPALQLLPPTPTNPALQLLPPTRCAAATASPSLRFSADSSLFDCSPEPCPGTCATGFRTLLIWCKAFAGTAWTSLRARWSALTTSSLVTRLSTRTKATPSKSSSEFRSRNSVLFFYGGIFELVKRPENVQADSVN
jgi:hypothetical protein